MINPFKQMVDRTIEEEYNELFWMLVYLTEGIKYAKQHHPVVYDEMGMHQLLVDAQTIINSHSKDTNDYTV